MAETRMLKGTDILEILQGTCRPFGRCTRFIQGNDHLLVQDALRRGEGMICGIEYGDVNHIVAVYRHKDGTYVYYDNENNPPNATFYEYCSRNGIQHHLVKRLRANTKAPQYSTCAYHALTFLDFAVRCRKSSVFVFMKQCKRYLGSNPNEKVVLSVKAIINEFQNDLSLSVRDNYNARSIIPTIPHLFNPHPYCHSRMHFTSNHLKQLLCLY